MSEEMSEGTRGVAFRTGQERGKKLVSKGICPILTICLSSRSRSEFASFPD